jgi:hypothetical protein
VAHCPLVLHCRGQRHGFDKRENRFAPESTVNIILCQASKVAEMVEHLPSKPKAVGSNFNTARKRRGRESNYSGLEG